jgi:hypothetical protein
MSAQLTHEGTRTRTTETAAFTSAGRLQSTWRRLGKTVHEMNYATRRVVELQAPWIVDEQWHSR